MSGSTTTAFRWLFGYHVSSHSPPKSPMSCEMSQAEIFLAFTNPNVVISNGKSLKTSKTFALILPIWVVSSSLPATIECGSIFWAIFDHRFHRSEKPFGWWPGPSCDVMKEKWPGTPWDLRLRHWWPYRYLINLIVSISVYPIRPNIGRYSRFLVQIYHGVIDVHLPIIAPMVWRIHS